jgi:hypothetical protein
MRLNLLVGGVQIGCMGGAGVARNFLLQLVNEIKANTAVDATNEVVGSWRYGRLQ